MRFDFFTIDFDKSAVSFFLITFFMINDNKSLFHIHWINNFLFEICLFYKIIYFKNLDKE